MAFPSWRSVATCVASGMSYRRNAIGGSPPPRRCVSPARRAATNCCAPATVRTAPAPAAPITTVPTVSPLGHLPHLRGELGRLFLHPGQRTAARTDPLRYSQHQPFRLGDPGGRRVRALRRHPQGQTGPGRLPQRTEQLRLDRRDRPVRPAIGTGQAHRSRPLRPRRPGLRPGPGPPGSLLLRRRLAERVHLQVRQPRQVPSGSQQRSPARRRHPLRRPLQRRWQRPVAPLDIADGNSARLSQGRGELRRPGRSADQHPPGRRCPRRDQDGSPGGARQPGQR